MMVPIFSAAQPDTSYGQGRIEVVDSRLNPVTDRQAVMTPIQMQDSLANVVYSFTTDSLGGFDYDVITRLNYRIGITTFEKSDIRVHPVPGNELNVYVPMHYQSRGPLTLALIDRTGALVEQQILRTNYAYFNMQSHPAGVYVVRISDAHGKVIESKKIIVQDGPVYGPQPADPAISTKRIQTTPAEYQLTVNINNPKDSLGNPTTLGHYPLDTIITIEQGQNNLQTYQLQEWLQDS
ncbi:MAG: T9SS type A sorting domain-containing protein, partial [Cryomorphaceae bacterium]|nr:T9SS type A sorting domain-containing protein [Cryomorphaceae bacterium]